MIELDKDLVARSNNQSMYNRGSHIQDNAELDYKKFIDYYSKYELNDKQRGILEKRKIEFKELLTNCYNYYLSSAANFVPIIVAGPSKYSTHRMEKVLESMNKRLKDMEEKIYKFYKNTDYMLKNAYTKEEIIKKYRNGYNEPISSDDPLIKEKLQAKLEFLEEKHQSYLDFNKKARNNNTEQLPSYVLNNSNQNIKSVKDRIKLLEKMDKLQMDNYYFDDGEVRFDKEENRVKIYFDDIPNRDIRDELKRHAYKWSPKNLCWQRKLTPDAIYMTKKLFKDNKIIEPDIGDDYTKTI